MKQRRQGLDLLKQKTAQENGPVRTANKCRTDAPATAKGIPFCAAAVSENTQKGSGIPHGPLSVHASVKTISQAYSCLKEGADRLYLPHTFLRGDWEAALKDMKNEFPGAELYLSLPVILRKQDEARLERLSPAWIPDYLTACRRHLYPDGSGCTKRTGRVVLPWITGCICGTVKPMASGRIKWIPTARRWS